MRSTTRDGRRRVRRGWGYADVLPYFRKLEARVDHANPYQGDGGPVQVSTATRPNPHLARVH